MRLIYEQRKGREKEEERQRERAIFVELCCVSVCIYFSRYIIIWKLHFISFVVVESLSPVQLTRL